MVHVMSLNLPSLCPPPDTNRGQGIGLLATHWTDPVTRAHNQSIGFITCQHRVVKQVVVLRETASAGEAELHVMSLITLKPRVE